MRLTLSIIVVCIAVFIAQNIVPGFFETFALVPALAVSGRYWQFFTYMFLHGSLFHIAINMLILFMFGALLERAMGWRWYLTVFILSGIGSAFFHIALTGESLIPMIGASGGVFGIVTAFAFMFPNTRFIIFPLPVPIRAIHAVIGIAVLELFLGIFNMAPGIASFGHLGGIITGVLIMLYWKYVRARRFRTKKEVREFEFYWE